MTFAQLESLLQAETWFVSLIYLREDITVGFNGLFVVAPTRGVRWRDVTSAVSRWLKARTGKGWNKIVNTYISNEQLDPASALTLLRNRAAGKNDRTWLVYVPETKTLVEMQGTKYNPPRSAAEMTAHYLRENFANVPAARRLAAQLSTASTDTFRMQLLRDAERLLLILQGDEPPQVEVDPLDLDRALMEGSLDLGRHGLAAAAPSRRTPPRVERAPLGTAFTDPRRGVAFTAPPQDLILDEFQRAYVEAALWSSDDEAGVPLIQNHDEGDIEPTTIHVMKNDCNHFQAIAGPELRLVGLDDDPAGGHNFWLTRNRHGAGFWDMGLGDVGRRLTELAHTFVEFTLYVGDDGQIHGTQG